MHGSQNVGRFASTGGVHHLQCHNSGVRSYTTIFSRRSLTVACRHSCHEGAVAVVIIWRCPGIHDVQKGGNSVLGHREIRVRVDSCVYNRNTYAFAGNTGLVPLVGLHYLRRDVHLCLNVYVCGDITHVLVPGNSFQLIGRNVYDVSVNQRHFARNLDAKLIEHITEPFVFVGIQYHTERFSGFYPDLGEFSQHRVNLMNDTFFQGTHLSFAGAAHQLPLSAYLLADMACLCSPYVGDR